MTKNGKSNENKINLFPLKIAIFSIFCFFFLIFFVWYYNNASYYNLSKAPIQSVNYMHKTHLQKVGMDCLYCHTNVFDSKSASVPSTESCLTCHNYTISENPEIKPLHLSFKTNTPINYRGVINFPDFAYFNHSSHTNAGVSCTQCHGDVQNMKSTYQAKALSMSQCISCHKNPILVPKEEVTNFNYKGEFIKKNQAFDAPTTCGGCHR